MAARCFTCQTTLADIRKAYELMVQIKTTNADTKTHVTKRTLDTSSQMDQKDIFEMLHLDNICCRTHIMTAMNFHDMELGNPN